MKSRHDLTVSPFQAVPVHSGTAFLRSEHRSTTILAPLFRLKESLHTEEHRCRITVGNSDSLIN